MSPAVRTLTNRSGSMRPTIVLRKGVRFCCLLRPQSSSLHFPARVPRSPFAQALPLGAPRRQKKRRGRWSTPHTSHAAACCFMWLTRVSPARLRSMRFRRVLASLQVGENFPRLRRAARCEVTVRGRHAIACRRLNALCGIAFAGTTRAPVACPSALSSSCAASIAVACACVDTQDCQASQCRAGCGAPRTTAARAALFACGRRLLPPPGSFLYSMGALARFSVDLDVRLWACVHMFFQGFRLMSASKCEKFSGLAGAHGHS